MAAVVDKLYVGCLNKDASVKEIEEVCSMSFDVLVLCLSQLNKCDFFV